MSTPDQPETPPLTRKLMREIRNTGATPVIIPETELPAADPHVESAAESIEPEAPEETSDAPPAAVAHLARAAEPVAVPPSPGPDAAVDLGASPITRRQARQQERIRTASVPVITPDLLPDPVSTSRSPEEPEGTATAESAAHDWSDHESTDSGPSDVVPVSAVPVSAVPVHAADAPERDDADLRILRAESDADAASEIAADDAAERAVLNPLFGAGLLASEPGPVTLPPSFDELLARDSATTGSVATPHALIVSQAPSDAPLVAPVAATGEVLVTGTFVLPEGLGSTGHARGTADGKEIDATLIDGELPAHSSPTPIAASAAISTVKTNAEIIRPPAPEKGGKLMLTLAITAGVLALALVGVLVFALVTGVFS